jgi:2-polyprenyl-3-methyl-5-hydroxy-6-metoxy-1,4-benzoquinol methylase
MIKKNCRLCKSKNLKMFLDLGHHPPSDQFIKENRINKKIEYYPLKVNNCMSCGFKQLNYVVDPKILYQEDYPYESSLTKDGNNHFKEFANSCKKKFLLNKIDIVVDVGSNVGNLLSHFKNIEIKTLGVDPAKNICQIANKRGIKTINSFFNQKICHKIKRKYGRSKIITGSNVFAHIDDLDEFFKSVKILLKTDGVLIVEVPYFLNLIKNLEYDTIYHEHLSYITLLPLIKYLNKKNLEIFDVEEKDIHGGSIRIFIGVKKKFQKSKKLKKILIKEKQSKLNDMNNLLHFSEKVKKNRMQLVNLLIKLKSKNKKIIVLSAPAKGMTLLNYCKIDKDLIDFATEKSKLKINSFTPGVNIKVFSDREIYKKKPDYALILAWNFYKEIIRNNKKFFKLGGKFIVPVPKPRIIGRNFK